MNPGRRPPTRIADHAVDRYIERHRNDIERKIRALKDEARADLQAEVDGATITERTTTERHPVWRAKSGLTFSTQLLPNDEVVVGTVLPKSTPKKRR
jgi:hypothetical protein